MQIDIKLESDPSHANASLIDEGNVVKRWPLQAGSVCVINWQAHMHFFVEKGAQRILIKPHLIEGIPSSLPMQVAMWQAFLTDTLISIKPLGETADYKLSITPRLPGGGHIIFDKNKMWPGGVLPYEVDYRDFPVGTAHREVILAALQAWVDAETGFRFVPRTSETDFLFFCKGKRVTSFMPFDLEEEDDAGKGKKKASKPDKKKAASFTSQGLYSRSTSFSDASERRINDDSLFGRQGGKQKIRCTLFDGQVNQREVMQKMAEVLGFFPELWRDDRSHFVKLYQEGKLEPFAYKKLEKAHQVGQYDLWSIMHDPIDEKLPTGLELTLTFSLDEAWKKEIGRKAQLSSGDIAAAKELFQKSQKVLQQSIYHSQIEKFCRDFARESNRYREHVSPSSIIIDKPQWMYLKQKADKYYKEGDFSEAFGYYSTLLMDYEAVIPHWLPYPLMANMVASCYFRCGMYALNFNKDYAVAEAYVEEAIQILKQFAFLSNGQQLEFAGMASRGTKDELAQREAFNSEMRARILSREHLLLLIKNHVDPTAISFKLPPILGHTSGEGVGQSNAANDFLHFSDDDWGTPTSDRSPRLKVYNKTHSARQIKRIMSDKGKGKEMSAFNSPAGVNDSRISSSASSSPPLVRKKSAALRRGGSANGTSRTNGSFLTFGKR